MYPKQDESKKSARKHYINSCKTLKIKDFKGNQSEIKITNKGYNSRFLDENKGSWKIVGHTFIFFAHLASHRTASWPNALMMSC